MAIIAATLLCSTHSSAGTWPADAWSNEQLTADWRYQDLITHEPRLTDWDIQLLIESRLDVELANRWIDWLSARGLECGWGYHTSIAVKAGFISPAQLDDIALYARIPSPIRELILRRALLWRTPALNEYSDYSCLAETALTPDQVLDWCAWLQELGLSGNYGQRIERYWEMGFTGPSDISAIQSPNRPTALLVLAATDWNSAIYGAHAWRKGEGMVSGARFTALSLAEYYSVFPLVLDDETELLDLQLPGTREGRRLLLIYGHGDPEPGGLGDSPRATECSNLSIRLGSNWECRHGAVLGVGDSQLAWFIDQFADDAPVVLLGCDTRAAVDFIHENAGRRPVWGTCADFYASDLDFSPLRMEWDHPVFSMRVVHNGKNVTYRR